MYLKTDIIAKINGLQEYCNQNKDPNVSGNFENFMLPLETTVNTYFASVPNGLAETFVKYITQIFMDLQKRHTTYENQFGSQPSTNYPQGYLDLGEIFGNGAFNELMNISGSEFLAGFPKIRDTTTSESGTETQLETYHYETNPIIEQWITQIENAHGSENTKIENIINFCERNTYNDGMISMFEDRGNITINITKEELAHDIYISKGAKIVIQNFNLNVYIPSYI